MFVLEIDVRNDSKFRQEGGREWYNLNALLVRVYAADLTGLELMALQAIAECLECLDARDHEFLFEWCPRVFLQELSGCRAPAQPVSFSTLVSPASVVIAILEAACGREVTTRTIQNVASRCSGGTFGVRDWDRFRGIVMLLNDRKRYAALRCRRWMR